MVETVMVVKDPDELHLDSLSSAIDTILVVGLTVSKVLAVGRTAYKFPTHSTIWEELATD